MTTIVGVLSLFCDVIVGSLLVSFHVVKALILWISPRKRKSLTDEIVLITGGGKGIGRLLAVEFAKHRPKHIIVWGRHEDTLITTAKAVRSHHVPCTPIVCDVSNQKMIREKAQEVRSNIGDVTILVNNAGVVYGNDVIDSRPEDIQNTIEVNTLAHFWTIKAFLPQMSEWNHGHIVAINSMYGYMGLAGAADYCASKYALTGMLETLYQELLNAGKTGVHITSVHPYTINTDMFAGCSNRFPWLFPSLEKEYVVEKTVDAVLTETYQLLMPWSMYPFLFFKSFLPIEALQVVQHFTGADRTMQTFHGRVKQS